jgi:hypothetical protein
VNLIVLALVASFLLAAALALGQGGNSPASTEESAATSGRGMTAEERTGEEIGTVRQLFAGALYPQIQVNTLRHMDRLCPIRIVKHCKYVYLLPVSDTPLKGVEFEPLLDVAETARFLRIHPKTLRVKACRGIIPAVQIGRVWGFRASALNRWLEGISK